MTIERYPYACDVCKADVGHPCVETFITASDGGLKVTTRERRFVHTGRNTPKAEPARKGKR